MKFAPISREDDLDDDSDSMTVGNFDVNKLTNKKK
jgi:hypothetical protein